MRKRIVYLFLLIAPLLLAACNNLPDVGQTVVLKERGMAALSVDDLKEMNSKIANEDMTGLQEMVNAGRAFVLPAGIRGPLISKSLDRAEMEIEVSGRRQRLWLESELLQSAGE